MQDVFPAVKHTRETSAQLQEHLAARHGLSAAESPLDALGMCHNISVMSLELLYYYLQVWGGTVAKGTVTEDKRIRHENGERVVLITKTLVIMSLSAFEFGAKQAVLTRPGKVEFAGGRIYLPKIMHASVQAGLIGPETCTCWEGLTKLRNCLVHNNGIADETATYTYPGGLTVALSNGRMTQGNLHFFPGLTNWATGAFADWCEAFLNLDSEGTLRCGPRDPPFTYPDASHDAVLSFVETLPVLKGSKR